MYVSMNSLNINKFLFFLILSTMWLVAAIILKAWKCSKKLSPITVLMHVCIDYDTSTWNIACGDLLKECTRQGNKYLSYLNKLMFQSLFMHLFHPSLYHLFASIANINIRILSIPRWHQTHPHQYLSLLIHYTLVLLVVKLVQIPRIDFWVKEVFLAIISKQSRRI